MISMKRTQRVVFQPDAARGMQRGINQIVNVVRPTLGPRPRTVAVDRLLRGAMPEVLDNGGVIARRIIELPERDADMGAMFVRNMLWRLYEQVGDGTATAAVVFQSVYNQGLRYIAAGGDAMRLRRYLEQAIPVILDALTGMTSHVAGHVQLAQIAEAMCYDPPLATMLGEIFDIIGEYGQMEVRSGPGREMEREYVEGAYWESGILSRHMLTDQVRLKTELEKASMLISDLTIDDPRQLVPLLEMARASDISALAIIARHVSDSAISLLLANQEPGTFQVIAVKTPRTGADDHAAALEDLTRLAGGRRLLEAAGDTISQARLQDLGVARKVWADPHFFGIIGGRGDARQLRQHIRNLRSAFKRAEDLESRKKLQQRISKLMGGSAMLWVGGATTIAISARKAMAERTADVLRAALREGVAPGGGVALLACCPVLQDMAEHSTDVDERAAYRILLRALEEPIRTIIDNAGYDVGSSMADIKRAGTEFGFDVSQGQVVEMAQAGILDAATVQKAAVRSAVTSAALALTIDVLVHRKHREEATTP